MTACDANPEPRLRPLLNLRSQTLGLPQLQDALIGPCGNQIPVGVVGDAYRALVCYLQQVLQLASLATKAVDSPIFSQAVNPLPPRGNPAGDKLPALTLTRLESLDHLEGAQVCKACQP